MKGSYHMNDLKEFIQFVDELLSSCSVDMSDGAKKFYENLKTQQEQYENKPLFTETGIQILEYLQSCGSEKMKAKDIAEGMTMPSRKINGSIRKLVSDGYVEKFGSNPVFYTITDKGKEFNIKEYKGE